jgi:2'-5' RNA ligase
MDGDSPAAPALPGRLRLFCAARLPAPLARELARVELPRALAREFRAVPADRLHLTLLFLGSVPVTQLPQVLAGFADAQLPPGFSLTPGSPGVFPETARARVLWLGLRPQAPALACHRALRVALGDLVESPDDRPWTAHLTLGRWRRPPTGAALREWLAAQPPHTGLFPVATVEVLASEPGPTGPTYRALATRQIGP